MGNVLVSQIGVKYTGSHLERANRCKENCSLQDFLETVILNIAVSHFSAKESVHCKRMAVASGTQCKLIPMISYHVVFALSLNPLPPETGKLQGVDLRLGFRAVQTLELMLVSFYLPILRISTTDVFVILVGCQRHEYH